jgi:dolichol-phosphate mannosyltransferase
MINIKSHADSNASTTKANAKAFCDKVDISIIIPTLNECKNIGKTIELLHRNLFNYNIEVIVIDGGSTDCTKREAQKAIADHGLCGGVFNQLSKGGKPAALLEGFMRARGRYVAVIDADLEYDPSVISILLKVAELKGADLVVGQRKDKRSPHRQFISFGAKILAWLLIKEARKFRDPTAEVYLAESRKLRYCLPKLRAGIKPFLEIISKCPFEKIEIVSMEQRNRIYGSTKFRVTWIIDYLVQIIEILIYKFGHQMHTEDI